MVSPDIVHGYPFWNSPPDFLDDDGYSWRQFLARRQDILEVGRERPRELLFIANQDVDFVRSQMKACLDLGGMAVLVSDFPPFAEEFRDLGYVVVVKDIRFAIDFVVKFNPDNLLVSCGPDSWEISACFFNAKSQELQERLWKEAEKASCI